MRILRQGNLCPIRPSWRWLLPVALTLYAALGTYQLHLPGLYYDEALDAVPAMQIVLGKPIDAGAVVRLAGREWPLMVMPYVGCTTTYLLVPVFALLGVSVISLRLANLLIGAIALLLAWGFAREFLDERVAAVSTLLLAVNPSFIFWTRIGASVSLPMLPLAIASLWCLYRWYAQRIPAYLVVASFCLGLGLNTKVLFLWFWAALVLAWLVLSPTLHVGAGRRAWLWPWQRAKPGTWALAGLALLLGSGMLLAYNLRGWETLRFMLRNVGQTELYGVNNLAVPGNLRTVVLGDLRAFLEGTGIGEGLGPVARNVLGMPALGLALVAIIWLCARGKLAHPPRRLALLVIVLVSIVIQSAFTITGLGATHLVILWPIPQVLVAVALLGGVDAMRTARPSGYWPFLLGTLIVLLVGAEAWTTIRYHSTLARTGGVGRYSDAIYALARDLDQPGTPKPVALDWGFRRNLQLLTQGRLYPEEHYDYSQAPGAEFAAWMNRRVTESPALYLFHSPQYTAFGGHWEAFEEAAYGHRLVPVLWRSYTQRTGETVYLVYALEPAPRLFQPPAMSHALDARLGDGLTLLGYDLPNAVIQADGIVRLTLYWQTQVRQTWDLKVFVHLLDEAGTIRAQQDGWPVYWAYPTSAWEAGEVVPDRVRLQVGKASPGVYRLAVGMYDETTGKRLPVWQDGVWQPDDRLFLTTITVSEAAGS
jgi:4-amino-4-deoxy-L-arabinose transferase-like glycosyltransferase